MLLETTFSELEDNEYQNEYACENKDCMYIFTRRYIMTGKGPRKVTCPICNALVTCLDQTLKGQSLSKKGVRGTKNV